MKKKFFTTLFIIILLMSSGCKKQEAFSEVRIAFFPNITHAQALYGKNTGLYEQAFGDDISVKWVQFNAGPAEIEAMFAGEVDIGYIGPIPAINAFIKSKGDVKIIAGAANGGAVMVTKSGLTLDSPSQLSGLKVAVPQLGNTQHISLLNILRENGLETSDKGGSVEVVQAENADIKSLLDRGNIDAALVPEPWGARMINEVGANLFLDEKQIWREGNYPVAVVIVNMDFMDKNPEAVKVFLQTHLKITDKINDDLVEAEKIINDELLVLTQKQLVPVVLEEAFGRVAVTSNIDNEIMDDFIVLLANEGFIETPESRPGLVYTEMLHSLKGEN